MVSKYPGLTVTCNVIQEFKSMTDYTVTQSYRIGRLVVTLFETGRRMEIETNVSYRNMWTEQNLNKFIGSHSPGYFHFPVLLST